MRNDVQVRERIWASIERHGGASKVSEATRPSPDEPPAVSASMLHKFKRADGPLLGPDSVNALQLVLEDIEERDWMAALGVRPRTAEVVAPEAGA